MKWTIHRVTVTEQDASLRLDQYLAQTVDDLSRTVAKKLIDLGAVHVNGRRVRSCSKPVSIADSIEVYCDHFPLDPYRISSDEIIYQDKYLIVLNKPAQIDTQPTHARYKGTLYEALQVHLQDPFRRYQRPQIGMIQRLDRGTSGLIVFSLHPRAHGPMTQIFQEHQLQKNYLALVHNVPDPSEGEIVSSLARSRKTNRVHSVRKGGKEAVTRYRVQESFSDSSLVELELITGRSHQIRAHMSELGSPLLGDTRYDGKNAFSGCHIERPLLHSSRLCFCHPVLQKKLDFTVDLPDDMVRVYNALKERA